VVSYERCRKQFWFRYLSGYPWPESIPTPAGVIGTGVHRAMKTLCETGDPEDGRSELDVYLRMPAHECAGPGTEGYSEAFALFENGCQAHDTIVSEDSWAERDTWVPRPNAGVTLQAKIDRVDRLGPLHWQVVDWKTGRWDFDDVVDSQLDLGHIAARTCFQLPREATVTALAWNLRNGRQRVRELTRDDAVATIKRFVGLAHRIQSTEEFEATPNSGCRFCEWRDRCPEAEQMESGTIDWLDDEDELDDPRDPAESELA
jgi:hypothetical protein